MTKKKLKKYIHDGWGLGSLTHFMTPLIRTVLLHVKEDHQIISKWIKMYFRYFQNWLHESYEYSRKRKYKIKSSRGTRFFELMFKVSNRMLNSISKILRSMIKRFERTTNHLVDIANSMMKKLLPKIEPVYLGLNRLLKPVTERLSQKLIHQLDHVNPIIFEESSMRRKK